MQIIRRACLALACACASFALAAPAWAGPDPNWASSFAGQSPFLTLESGQLAQSQFSAKNVGTQTWSRTFVNLATVNSPYNFPDPSRNSPFEVVNDWLGANRPTRLDQDSVPPQQVGTFTFRVRAPQVSVRTDYQEHFAPVAEQRAWMGCDDGCQWANVYLMYTVYPPQDPTVSVDDGTRTVTKGDPIDVRATATDNVGLDRVVFSLEDQQITVNAAPYAARFSSAGLDAGPHTLTARAYDRAGHSASDSVVYTVKDAQGGGGVPQPPTDNNNVPGVGVTINEGQIYTNSPIVRLTLRPPHGATGATIANDGLADPHPVALNGGGDQVVSWTLNSSGPERLPKTVFVHFTGPGVDASSEHTDNIILDQTKPTVSRVLVVAQRRGNRRVSAKSAGGLAKGCANTHLTLKVRAHDNVSHVRSLTYRFGSHGKPAILNFNSTVPVTVPPKLRASTPLFVAVRDGALNLSKVRRVNLRKVCR